MSGYCKYCGKLIPKDDIIKEIDPDHRPLWVGCIGCYKKRRGLKQDATVKK